MKNSDLCVTWSSVNEAKGDEPAAKQSRCAGKRHRGTHRVHCVSKSASQENTHSMQKRESWKKIPSAQREISDEGFLTSETQW